ncbi:anti-sigma factor family protein [Streptomyces bohaiensis]|uniref:anti-sigma factor family protein n=1 Tax=Streptomyces bohaiensis TaxID=1431344 RepID=UPI003B762225
MSSEQHLGDSLAALIDGELSHDHRDRVLAHLATCAGCRAEADAQRRLKSAFAQTPPPPPSDTLLARLQGLPAAPAHGDEDDAGRPGGWPGASGALSAPGRRSPFTPSVFGGSGFPVHREGARRATGGRGALPVPIPLGSPGLLPARPPRGHHRFAFAAAGAVSLAAVAIGGGLAVTAGSSTAPTGVPVAMATSGGASPGQRPGTRPEEDEGLPAPVGVVAAAGTGEAVPGTFAGHPGVPVSERMAAVLVAGALPTGVPYAPRADQTRSEPEEPQQPAPQRPFTGVSYEPHPLGVMSPR